jgi:hypothetical protein
MDTRLTTPGLDTRTLAHIKLAAGVTGELPVRHVVSWALCPTPEIPVQNGNVPPDGQQAAQDHVSWERAPIRQDGGRGRATNSVIPTRATVLAAVAQSARWRAHRFRGPGMPLPLRCGKPSAGPGVSSRCRSPRSRGFLSVLAVPARYVQIVDTDLVQQVRCDCWIYSVETCR